MLVREQLRPRPAAAVDVRAARTRSGGPDRPRVRGRAVSVIFDAGMSRPLRLTAGRGAGAGGGAAHARRDARRRRRRRRAARAGQGRGGGRGRGRRHHCGGRPRRRATAAAGAAALARRAPRTVAALLHGHAGRDDRAGRRPVATVRPPTDATTSRRGAGAPRACGCSGVDRMEDVQSCSTSPRRRRRTSQLRDLAEGLYQPAPSTCLPCFASRRPMPGCRLLPDRVGRWRPTAGWR